MNSPALFDALARYRLSLSCLLFAALIAEWLINDGGRSHSLLSLGDAVHFAGVGLIVAGTALRSWAAGFIQKKSVLTTGGPYAFVRHPLYLGSGTVALGFAVLTEDVLALIVIVTAIPALYLMVVRREEFDLGARFGVAWMRYAAETAAVLPRRRGKPLDTAWSWARWRRNREGRVVAQILVLLVLLEFLNGWVARPM